jgi:hypothetical protein
LIRDRCYAYKKLNQKSRRNRKVPYLGVEKRFTIMKYPSRILLCLGLFWLALVSVVSHYQTIGDGRLGLLYGVGTGFLVLALIIKPRRASN